MLTSGLTFLTVLSLYLFGGEVLHGFSFALVVGILIGTYSSIAVAAPMLVAYQDWRAKQGKACGTTGGKGGPAVHSAALGIADVGCKSSGKFVHNRVNRGLSHVGNKIRFPGV